MANSLFYVKPVILSRSTHRNARVQSPPADFSFAAGAHAVQLVVSEFREAAREYPIVFAEADEGRMPVALLGLREGENLFIDRRGGWDAGYIPASLRRYPFVLGEDADQDSQVVCVDENYAGFGDVEGDALFDEEGQSTATLTRVMKFLKEYHRQYLRTRKFVQSLEEHELLVGLDARVDLPDGRQFGLSGMFVVDEKRLLELPDDQVLQHFRERELGWIYCQLMSLGSLPELAARVARLMAETVPPAGARVH